MEGGTCGQQDLSRLLDPDFYSLLTLLLSTELDLDLKFVLCGKPKKAEQIPHYVTSTSSNVVTDSCTSAKARERRRECVRKYRHKILVHFKRQRMPSAIATAYSDAKKGVGFRKMVRGSHPSFIIRKVRFPFPVFHLTLSKTPVIKTPWSPSPQNKSVPLQHTKLSRSRSHAQCCCCCSCFPMWWLATPPGSTPSQSRWYRRQPSAWAEACPSPPPCR